MGDNYRPRDGAYARVDLTFRGTRYMAGEPFPVNGLSDDKLRQLHSAKRIAFGQPPQSLLDRAAARIAALEGRPDARALTGDQAKAALGVNAPPGEPESVKAKVRAKLAEQRAERDARQRRRVSSVSGAGGRKGPVRTNPRELRKVEGREASGPDPDYDPNLDPTPELEDGGESEQVETEPAKSDAIAPADVAPAAATATQEAKGGRGRGEKAAPILAPR